jgi:flagellar hook-associated protein 1 FlgK
MGSLFALLGTMQDGLAAQQAALDVTGQNITNVNTPGYVNRTAVLESRAVMPGTDGGVDVAEIQRAFNSFTYSQVLVSHGQNSAAQARSSSLGEAQAVVAPQGGGAISDAMNAFFTSLQTLTASPSDPSVRSAVLANATQLAQSFSTTANGLSQMKSSLYSQAQGTAGEVNQDLTQIATLNSQIAQAQATGDNAPDLRDKRDSLVTTVADAVGARVVPDASGTITLFAAGGVLVSGNKASSLGVSLDTSGVMKFTVSNPGGAPMDVTSGVTDGTLGGLREARDVDVAQTSTQLDQLAYDFSNSVNSVHSAGYGLDGVSGRPLFAPPVTVAGAAANMAVDPSVAGQPNNIAAAANAQDVPGGNDVAIQLAQIATQSLGTGGPPAQQFASIAAQLGSAKSSADSDASTRADMMTQAENLNSSASGVSLNEEMVNLTRFQQAFQAATRVLQVADSLLGDFMTTMSTA